MANEQFIDQIVTPEAEAGVQRLKAELSELNQQFIDTARGIAQMQSVLGSTNNLRQFNTEQARAAAAMERLNGIRLRNEITQERLNQTVARGVQQQQRATQAATAALTPYQQLIQRQKELALAAQNAGAQFGIQSEQYRNAAAQANTVNAQVSGINRGLGNFRDNVGNYASGIGSFFGNVFSKIRFLANVIPNFGIGTFFLLLGTGLAAVAKQAGLFSDAISTMESNLKNLNDVNKEANRQATDQSVNLKILYTAATDVNNSYHDRLLAARELQREFPNYFKNIQTETILNGGASASYQQLTVDIVANAKALAAISKIKELEAKKADIEFEKLKTRSARAVERDRLTAPTRAQSANTDAITADFTPASTLR